MELNLNTSFLKENKMTNAVIKSNRTNDYGEYPVEEIKKLYLCRAAYEEMLLKFETLKAENRYLKIENSRLKQIIDKDLTLIS